MTRRRHRLRVPRWRPSVPGWWPRLRLHPDPSTVVADRHLEQLRDQRAHVERLANALRHEQSENHFRQRVESALRRDPR